MGIEPNAAKRLIPLVDPSGLASMSFSKMAEQRRKEPKVTFSKYTESINSNYSPLGRHLVFPSQYPVCGPPAFLG
jgi:hypothetical protein